MGRFVDDIPSRNQVTMTFDAIGDAILLKAKDRFRIVVQPTRITVIPGQRMTLAPNALLGTPFRDCLGLRVAGLPLVWFVTGPVEADGGEVEKFGKPLAVVRLLNLVLDFIPIENIAAKQKRMSRLLNMDLGTRNGIPLAIDNIERNLPPSMRIDPRIRFAPQTLFAWFIRIDGDSESHKTIQNKNES